MDPDLFMVIGVTIAILTIPSLLSAFIEGRTPRAGAIMILIAGTLIVLALKDHPRGYELGDVPGAFYRVIGRYLH